MTNSKFSILIVEDDALARKVMGAQLGGHQVEYAHDGVEARKKLENGPYDLCFIDLQLGLNDDYSGLKLIPVASSKKIYSVVMSGHDSERVVEQAYALGCDDFYAKGNEEANVNGILARFQQHRSKTDSHRLFTQSFITQDPATQSNVMEALRYAPSDLPVLILGPSGTGKTSLARILHDQSGRPGEFVAINCSAYTEDLLEAELFGCRKGAFTGASENRKGKLLAANLGTLFLDEIGAMSLKMQTKLLKAIEERSFYPLGSDKPERSYFRIISATLEDIQGLVRSGKIRFDFFQRIHGLAINLKPLAERMEDLWPLIGFFTHTGRRLSFSEEAKEEIRRHDWPGNVREVKKFVELLAVGAQGRISAETARRFLNMTRVREEGRGFATEEQFQYGLKEGLDAAAGRFKDSLIERALAESGGDRDKASKALGVSKLGRSSKK